MRTLSGFMSLIKAKSIYNQATYSLKSADFKKLVKISFLANQKSPTI